MALAGHVPMQHAKTNVELNHSSLKEPKVVRWLLTFIALAFLALFLVLPLITIFMTAFQKGWETYLAAITNSDALAAYIYCAGFFSSILSASAHHHFYDSFSKRVGNVSSCDYEFGCFGCY